jgi:hypothetical protein
MERGPLRWFPHAGETPPLERVSLMAGSQSHGTYGDREKGRLGLNERAQTRDGEIVIDAPSPWRAVALGVVRLEATRAAEALWPV